LLLVALSFIAVLWLLRRRADWRFGLCWIAIWLAPTNSLLARLEVANDRQWYLALTGVAWLLACAARVLLTRIAAGPTTSASPMNSAQRVVAALATLTIFTLAIATTQRNRVYDNEISFWNDASSKSPTNARAANNLGYALAAACRDAEAEHSFSRALVLDPNFQRAEINLALLQQGALFPQGRHCPSASRP
jgi:tetratricopeptide (TPR) repeat protein